jgi:hypothetical protein
MTDNQVLPERVSVAGPARLDRGFAGRESAEQNLENWLHQIAGKIGPALYRRIPIGFEDETGFHLGVQPVRGDTRMDWERARIFVDDEHF